MLKEIVNTNIKGNLNKKICLISDIHFYKNYNKKIFNLILKNIEENKPDYICISGDIIDKPDLDIEELKDLKTFLESLTKIAKVIISLGNHDVTVNNIFIINNEYINFLKSIKNLYLLIDEEIILDNIRFIGYFDSLDKTFSSEKYDLDVIEDYNKLFSKINIKDDKYNILLAHNPLYLIKDNVNKKITDFKYLHLILCGHTHGGLVPNFIKGHRGIISPSKKFFPKDIRGVYQKGNTNIIICNGVVKLSNTSKLFKYFNFLFPVTINYINVNGR